MDFSDRLGNSWPTVGKSKSAIAGRITRLGARQHVLVLVDGHNLKTLTPNPSPRAGEGL